MTRIAIIPARSGSKGLKDKNVLDICGKPMLAYSIEAGIKSGLFDKVIVSTDSEKYADISREYGAEVIMRGENLSNDKATSYCVIEDVLMKQIVKPEYFVLLQPTSPLRTAKHVKEAVELFENRKDKFDFLVSVKKAELPSVLVKPIDEDGSLKYFDTDFSNYRRQGYSEYSPNGAIYIGKTDEYLNRKHFFGARSLAYEMSAEDSVDVDGILDYKLIKIIMESKNEY